MRIRTRMVPLMIFVGVGLIGVALIGCGARNTLPVAPTAIPTLAPATLPPSAPSGLASASPPPAGGPGAQVFNANCLPCHNLTGEKKVGPGLAGVFNKEQLPDGKPLTDQNMIDWIHTGGSGLAGYPAMPGFPQIQGQDLTALMAYLKQATQAVPATGAAASPAAPVAGSAPAPSSSAQGKGVFDASCSPCHSLTAAKLVGPGLAGMFTKPQLPNNKPMNEANLEEWIHTGGSGLSGYPPMPGFPQIQGSDLTALTAYLKEATGASAAPGPGATSAVTATAAATAPAAAATHTVTTTTSAAAASPAVAATSAMTATTTTTTTASAMSEAAAQGKTVFDADCVVCHNLTAEQKVGPGLAGMFGRPQLPNGKPVTDANVAEWIHDGGSGLTGYGPMPGFPQIRGADLTALVAYLKEVTQ